MQMSSENDGSWPTHQAEPTLLVVDDEAVIRTALSRYFARLGWGVRTAPNGRAAIETLTDRGVEFDLVICDLRMPSGSGEDVYWWLVRHRPALAGRLVFLSGDTVDPEMAAFLEKCGRPVLGKPFDLYELACMAEQLRAKRGVGSHSERSEESLFSR